MTRASTSRRRSVSFAALAALAALAAGCGGKSMTEDEFCKEYAKRECAKVADTCGFATTVCEPVRVSACQAMAAASKTGMRKFNADSAGKCLDQVNAAYASFPVIAAKLQALDLAC